MIIDAILKVPLFDGLIMSYKNQFGIAISILLLIYFTSCLEKPEKDVRDLVDGWCNCVETFRFEARKEPGKTLWDICHKELLDCTNYKCYCVANHQCCPGLSAEEFDQCQTVYRQFVEIREEKCPTLSAY